VKPTPRAEELDELLNRLYACSEAGAIATGTDVVMEETTCIRADADKAVLDGAIAMAWTMLDLAADHDLRRALLARMCASVVPVGL
jgi:hypothetical protein